MTGAVTVMITESEDVAVSSLAVSVKAMAVSESTRGAVKVVDEVALASVMSDEVELYGCSSRRPQVGHDILVGVGGAAVEADLGTLLDGLGRSCLD